LNVGVLPGEIRGAVDRGEWVVVTRGIYGLVSWADSPQRRLLAGCLATGGVASHRSAAWLWGFADRAPESPTLSVSHGRRKRVGHAVAVKRGPRDAEGLEGWRQKVVVHHSRDLGLSKMSNWQGIPTTNPLRTLVDLASVAEDKELDGTIDRALASGLVTVGGLVAEAERLKRRGRSGPPQLLKALVRRGFVGQPDPSVLESLLLRTLAAYGIRVVATEVVTEDERYRLDCKVAGGVFVEVDGYAFHSSPEQKERDEARRNALRLMGYFVLVYGWRTVMQDGRRVAQEVRTAQSLETASKSA
jgi:very-short-patch-repair endonuclease